MSFQKFKSNSYCVGGKHFSQTINIYGDTKYTNKKTQKPIKMLRGTCAKCNRNKSHIVSDQTIEAEGLKDFFKNVGKAAKNVGKKILNNPVRALEIATQLSTAAATKNPKLIASTAPDVLKFVHQGRGLYLVRKFK